MHSFAIRPAGTTPLRARTRSKIVPLAQATRPTVRALFSNTIGFSCTAVGVNALHENTTAGSNTAVGDAALYNNTTSGQYRHRRNALLNNTTGDWNTGSGFSRSTAIPPDLKTRATVLARCYNNTAGYENTAQRRLCPVSQHHRPQEYRHRLRWLEIF